MKKTAASVSEDGLTLHEYDFILARLGEDAIVFRLVAVRRWRRPDAEDLTPWGDVDGVWHHVDLFDKNTIRDKPELPDAILADARQFILQSIHFEL